jgi:hypothetical protein
MDNYIDDIIHEVANTPTEYSILRNEISMYLFGDISFLSLNDKSKEVIRRAGI